ncbi:MAG: hypothetical protein KGJ90_06655 [Patescibacteria group bacterium]|nr:hypothetical protein [Patescibacteria group bacterium]
MTKLTSQARKEIPKKDFAGPDKSYPIEDKNHARNALARSSGKAVHAEVVKKVERKYPDIRVDGKGYVHKVNHKN